MTSLLRDWRDLVRDFRALLLSLFTLSKASESLYCLVDVSSLEDPVSGSDSCSPFPRTTGKHLLEGLR